MRFALSSEQRDFAASIDAALGGADVPGAVRAWAKGDFAPGRAVWTVLADLGVTALAVPEEFGGIGAHPVDLVVACERLGRWCVPGPVTESLAVAPVLLAGDDRSAGLADGQLVATVAMPAAVPRAVDADFAGLTLLAAGTTVSDATPGTRSDSIDPARRLFDVAASGPSRTADVARAHEFGALATAAQLVGAAGDIRPRHAARHHPSDEHVETRYRPGSDQTIGAGAQPDHGSLVEAQHPLGEHGEVCALGGLWDRDHRSQRCRYSRWVVESRTSRCSSICTAASWVSAITAGLQPGSAPTGRTS